MHHHSDEITTWEPLGLFSGKDSAKEFALIILNQTLQLPVSIYRHLWSNATFKVAADGGANCLYTLNKSNESYILGCDAVIGDLDSLLPETRIYWEEKGVPIIRDTDQSTTDFTKAVNYIYKIKNRQPTHIVVLGGLGGRIDHGMSVLHQLFTLQTEPKYKARKIYLLSSESISFILQPGNHTIKAKQHYESVGLGKHVGIIPLKEASIISTTGLEWDVQDWETEIGGQVSTSNHVKNETVTIQTTKNVLFTIDLDIAKK